MKNLCRYSYLLLLLAVPAALHAQNGCVNSPENPTALLGLVGMGGIAVSSWSARRKR